MIMISTINYRTCRRIDFPPVVMSLSISEGLAWGLKDNCRLSFNRNTSVWGELVHQWFSSKASIIVRDLHSRAPWSSTLSLNTIFRKKSWMISWLSKLGDIKENAHFLGCQPLYHSKVPLLVTLSRPVLQVNFFAKFVIFSMRRVFWP